MDPLVSVIVPVYNVRNYLRQCLDSIIAQTEISWECICVNDGSIDGSGEICDEYANRDGRFKVLHQPNKGLPAARNSFKAAVSICVYLQGIPAFSI